MPHPSGVWHAAGSMFISVKRHEREKQVLLEGSNRLTDAILKTSSVGLFLVDAKGVLRQEWRKVKVNGHAEAVLAAVKAL